MHSFGLFLEIIKHLVVLQSDNTEVLTEMMRAAENTDCGKCFGSAARLPRCLDLPKDKFLFLPNRGSSGSISFSFKRRRPSLDWVTFNLNSPFELLDIPCNTKSTVKEGFLGLFPNGADFIAFASMTKVNLKACPGLA